MRVAHRVCVCLPGWLAASLSGPSQAIYRSRQFHNQDAWPQLVDAVCGPPCLHSRLFVLPLPPDRSPLTAHPPLSISLFLPPLSLFHGVQYALDEYASHRCDVRRPHRKRSSAAPAVPKVSAVSEASTADAKPVGSNNGAVSVSAETPSASAGNSGSSSSSGSSGASASSIIDVTSDAEDAAGEAAEASAAPGGGAAEEEEEEEEEEAVWFYDTLRDEQNRKWADEKVEKGVAHYKGGRVDEAFKCYEQALGLWPRHATALVARGCLLANRGDLHRAAVDLERALKVDPQARNARTYLDEVQQKLSRAAKVGRQRLRHQ